MKYAHDVINFLGAFPGRSFSMRHICRQINPKAKGMERTAMRQSVLRVLKALEGTGRVEVVKATTRSATYSWIEVGYGLKLPT